MYPRAQRLYMTGHGQKAIPWCSPRSSRPVDSIYSLKGSRGSESLTTWSATSSYQVILQPHTHIHTPPFHTHISTLHLNTTVMHYLRSVVAIRTEMKFILMEESIQLGRQSGLSFTSCSLYLVQPIPGCAIVICCCMHRLIHSLVLARRVSVFQFTTITNSS